MTNPTSGALARPLWWDQLPHEVATRPPLKHNIDVDVAVVGAGYTGLWTAHYLLERDPNLTIAVVERDHVAFGASGRNGGWCYDRFAASPSRIEKDSDLDTATRWGAVLRATVDEVGRVASEHGIECSFNKSGNIEFLRNAGQLERAHADIAKAHRYGWSKADTRILDASEANEIGKAAGVVGGLWSSNSASIQPAKLAYGLADSLERRGVTIYEATPATDIGSGRVTTPGGTVTAQMVVRATEGYTADLPGLKRLLAPLYSLMIATEPIPRDVWDSIGLANRELFGDLRHLVIYGQRTADDRIAFGGRGAPYDFGSRVRPNAEFPPTAFHAVHAALVDVFPQVHGVGITHRWGGVLGVTRGWYPTASIDRDAKLAWAGGFVGSGVAATNLAGRTLADLIASQDTELTAFPWVNRAVRKWEPEPLRWLGINAALRVMQSADTTENRGGGASARAELLWQVIE
ncbi:MAG: FAD-binding oxidoreductase [Acidimicrobiia bacterium]|nr:FAD-binding oxidoreductase [Acidimicrobiia bacterium]